MIGSTVTTSLHLALAPGTPTATTAPEWLQIVPGGTFSGVDGRGPFRVADGKAFIATSMKRGKIAVDENHSSQLQGEKGGAAPARGWIVELAERGPKGEPGIWGRVEWTAHGRRMVEAREYAFLSPVLRSLKAEPGLVVGVETVALTNTPNLTLASLHMARTGTEPMDLDTFVATLRDELKITDPTAGPDAIVTAIRTTRETAERHSAQPDPREFVPMALFKQTVDELHARNNGLDEEAATMLVDRAEADRKILPFMREFSIDLCKRDRGAFELFIGGPIAPFMKTFEPSDYSLQREMDRDRKAAPDDDTTRIAELMGHTPDDLKRYGKEA